MIAGVKEPKTRERLVDVLAAVGSSPLVVGRLPHEFSGGQCQRIWIARALVLNPEFIICDEPVSALDVSIRAQILNLLEEMKARYGLTLLFIAHDLAVVKAVSDRVAVMYLGRLCEVGPSEQLFAKAGASLYRAADRGDPGAGSGGAAGGERSGGRAAVADRAALRLPLSHPLPARRPAMRDEVPELREVAPDQFAARHHPLIEVPLKRLFFFFLKKKKKKKKVRNASDNKKTSGREAMKSFQVTDFNAPLKEVDQPTPQPAGTQVLIGVKPPASAIAICISGKAATISAMAASRCR